MKKRSEGEWAIKDIIKAGLLVEAAKAKKTWRVHMIRKPDFVYKEKTVKVDSDRHLDMLHNTLEHLESLKGAYAAGSATRHVISQACTRLKRLINRLEKNT